MKELYKKHRPTSFEELVGQESAIATLKPLLKKKKVPHTILLSGPAGCGKTTIALILARKLKAKGTDCKVIDSGQFNGIETVRKLQAELNLQAMLGDSKVYVMDECHNYTTAAQEAMLKMMEDTPEHVYFILCTTNPSKINKALKTRCTEIKVKDLKEDGILKVLKSTMKKERIKVPSDVIDRIIQFREGSARQLLVFLHQGREMKGKKKMLAAIQVADADKEAWDLNKLLLFDRQLNRDKIRDILKNIQQDPETIRRIMIAGASTLYIKGTVPDRCVLLIDCFSSNYYDTKMAGLVWSCETFLNAVTPRKKR